MSDTPNTPAYLEEAVYAAEGLTSRSEDQIRLAAQLSGASEEDIRPIVERRLQKRSRFPKPILSAAAPAQRKEAGGTPKKEPLRMPDPPTKINWNRTDEWGL